MKMAKKQNCRNCKWAAWDLTATGRKRYGNWAECTYKVAGILPASRSAIARELERPAGVKEFRDINIDCLAWEEAPRIT
jgi:hypothetical protein